MATRSMLAARNRRRAASESWAKVTSIGVVAVIDLAYHEDASLPFETSGVAMGAPSPGYGAGFGTWYRERLP